LHDGDPLADEIAEFVGAVRSRARPRVGVADGLRVIELCEAVSSAVKASIG